MNKQQTIDYLERFVQSEYFLEFVNKTEKLFIFGEDRWDSEFLYNNFIFFQFMIHNSDALEKLVEIANYQKISSETPFKSILDNSKKELQKMFGGKSKEMLNILNLTYKIEEYNPEFISLLKNEYPAFEELANDGRSMFYFLDDFLIYSVGQVFDAIEKVNNLYHFSFDAFIQSNLSLTHYLIAVQPFINDLNYKYHEYEKLKSKFFFEAINDVFQNTDNDLLQYQNLYPEKKVKFDSVNWNKFKDRFLDNLNILEKGFAINDINDQVKFYNNHNNLLENRCYFEQHLQVFPEVNNLTNAFTNYRDHKIKNKDLINKLNSSFDFQSIETKLENLYLKGVKLIEAELKKCEYVSKLKDEEIAWDTDMPFDGADNIGFLIETVESYLEESYYNFFSKS